MTDYLENFDKIHTTAGGQIRIAKNLSIPPAMVMNTCLAIIRRGHVTRRGKNYYACANGITVTIHAGSLTIITAHREK